MKKYFFFDIDGTLTNIHTEEFVQSGLNAVHELEKRGNFCAIATGRAYYKTKDVLKLTGIQNCVANGGAALIIDGQLVRNSPLDRDKALTIIHEADALGYGLLISINDSTDVVMKDHRFLDQAGERREPTHYIFRPDLNYDDLQNIYKIYVSIPEDEEHQMKNLNLLGHIRMHTPYLWYQHDAKDQGILDMMKYLKGDIKDVVVFGDGENDMVMFRPEWTSIAMGNGYKPLLKKASYVTDAAEYDGIYHACRHFNWL